MGRWIAKQKRAGTTLDTGDLKSKWMEDNWSGEYITNNCFFCGYAILHETERRIGCEVCPGRLVDKDFRCEDKNYHYAIHPIPFYNKLVSLDKKRQKKKAKARSG